MKTNFCAKLHEECAVFGVSLFGKTDAAGIAYNGLLSLQHRGQEGAGIAALKQDGNIAVCKRLGLVNEAILPRDLSRMHATGLAIAHTRYSTEGDKNTLDNIQPFLSDYLTGRIAVAHNGNLTNIEQLRTQLTGMGLTFLGSTDSEVAAKLMAYQIVQNGCVQEGIKEALKQLDGAFSFVILTCEGKLIAARDRHGFRPLCIGQSEQGLCVASESCALDSSGFTLLRDVEPGEIVVADKGEIVASMRFAQADSTSACIFEYIYFARPDSVLDGLSVSLARKKMGEVLSEEAPADADVVVGVPDSGLDAAAGFAAHSGIPLVSGFVKNRYIGRSFIYPSQIEREHAVRLKLNPLSINVAGKRIVLIDDSIVRGTTCTRIIWALKHAGATQVHMRICSPPFVRTCHWGTDIGDEDNLIANHQSIEDIRKTIGADSLAYASVEGVKRACAASRLDFCTYCFLRRERN